jgi:hypothetical protein
LTQRQDARQSACQSLATALLPARVASSLIHDNPASRR